MCASMHCCLSCADLRIKSCSESLKKNKKIYLLKKKKKFKQKVHTATENRFKNDLSPNADEREGLAS